jgi:hypothetical protein
VNLVDIVIRASDKTGGLLKRTSGDMKQIGGDAKEAGNGISTLTAKVMALVGAFTTGYGAGNALVGLWNKLTGQNEAWADQATRAKAATDALARSLKQQAQAIDDIGDAAGRTAELDKLANRLGALQSGTGAGGTQAEITANNNAALALERQNTARKKALEEATRMAEGLAKVISSRENMLKEQREPGEAAALRAELEQATKQKALVDATIEAMARENQVGEAGVRHLETKNAILTQILAKENEYEAAIADTTRQAEAYEQRLEAIARAQAEAARNVTLGGGQRGDGSLLPQYGAGVQTAYTAVARGGREAQGLRRQEMAQRRDEAEFNRVLGMAESKQARGIRLSYREQYALEVAEREKQALAAAKEAVEVQQAIKINTKAAADALEKLQAPS